MNKKDAGPEYLKAEDLIRDGKWCEYTLTIESVTPANTVKAADGKWIEHPIVSFRKAQKKFICGKTNRRLVIYAAGDSDESKWVGHEITLRACKGDWFGHKNIAALRVAPPQGDGPRPHIAKKDYGVSLTGQKVGSEAIAPTDHAEKPDRKPVSAGLYDDDENERPF